MTDDISFQVSDPSPGICVLSVSGNLGRYATNAFIDWIAVAEMRGCRGVILSLKAVGEVSDELQKLLHVLSNHFRVRSNRPFLIVPPEHPSTAFLQLALLGVLADNVPAALGRITSLNQDKETAIAALRVKAPSLRGVVADRQRREV